MRAEHLKDYYKPAYRRHDALKCVSLPGLAVLEFGVFSGSGIAVAHEYLKENGVGYSKIWGFDSFEGLPKEAPGVLVHPDWSEGAFNSLQWFWANSPHDVMIRLYEDFGDFGIEIDDIELVPGYFQDTLTDELALEVGPISFAGIDCDLYISAVQALDWIFRNNLQRPGTIIYHDDYGAGKAMNAGEYKAHLEMCQKYDVKTDCLYEAGTAAFIVR